MSDAIDRAAKVIGDILQADPQIAHEMYGDEPDQIARALADAGLLAPAPLREEWHAAYYGVGPDGVRHLRLIGTEGTREHADETRADCSRDEPDTRFFLVRRPVHDWIPVDPTEGDGSGAEREPTVPASQLRAFARLCVDGGDMTPAAARMLDRIIDGDGRAEK